MADLTKDQMDYSLTALAELMENIEFRQNGDYILFGEGETLAERDRSGAEFVRDIQGQSPEMMTNTLQTKVANLQQKLDTMMTQLDEAKNQAPAGVGYNEYQDQIARIQEHANQVSTQIAGFTSSVNESKDSAHNGETFVSITNPTFDTSQLLSDFAKINSKVGEIDARIQASNNPDYNDSEFGLSAQVDAYEGLSERAGKLTNERIGELTSGAAEYVFNADQARETRTNLEQNQATALTSTVTRLYDEKIAKVSDAYEITSLEKEKAATIQGLESKQEDYSKGVNYLHSKIDGLNTDVQEKDALKLDVTEKMVRHQGEGENFAVDYMKHVKPELGVPVNIAEQIRASDKDVGEATSLVLKKDGVYVTMAGGKGALSQIGDSDMAKQIKENGLVQDGLGHESHFDHSKTFRITVDQSLGINSQNPLELHGNADGEMSINAIAHSSNRVKNRLDSAEIVSNVVSAGDQNDNVYDAAKERAGQLAFGARREMAKSMAAQINRETQLVSLEKENSAALKTLPSESQENIQSRFSSMNARLDDIEAFAKGMPKQNGSELASTSMPGGGNLGNLPAPTGPSEAPSVERAGPGG